MQLAASFVFIFSIYFLGCLSLVQQVVRPKRHLLLARNTNKAQWVTNYSKILSLSLGISFLSASFICYLFL
jgi:hypothetical protein